MILQFLHKLLYVCYDVIYLFRSSIMNWKFWNRRYYLATVYALVVILISITYWKSFDHARSFTIMPLLLPFFIGFALAYILNFLLIFYERKIKRRALSLLAVYLTVVLLILAFILFLGPQVTRTMVYFTEEFPDYSEKIVHQIQRQLSRIDLSKDAIAAVEESMNELIDRFVTFNQYLVPSVIRRIVVISETVTNIILGIVLSIYILASKELLGRQFKKIILAVAGVEKEKVFRIWISKAHKIFAKFFAGMALNSLIVGVLTTIMLFIFRIPFAVLIGFIVAVTNIIPIFGPFIGAVPSAVMIFFISPTKALIFTIIILIIQQVDANIITPKILGDKIGIPSVWVLKSILIFGYFFGIVGLLLGVPVTALLIDLLGDVISTKIDKNTYKNSIKRK